MKKVLVLLVSVMVSLTSIAGGKQKVVKVKTSKQFIEAIASDTKIVVENDLLDMTATIQQLQGTGFLSEPDVDFSGPMVSDEFDGPSLVIGNVSNLTIEGKKSETHIQVTPRYADVLAFSFCKDITLKNLKLGHTDTGDCSGDVVTFNAGENFTIENCKLYGCGVDGLDLTGVNNVKVENSDIYECSLSILTFEKVKSAVFNNCRFYNNAGGMYIDEESSDIVFNNCKIFDNRNSIFSTWTNIVLNGCEIRHTYGGGESKFVKFNDCKVSITDEDCEYGDVDEEDEEDEDEESIHAASYKFAGTDFPNTLKDITDYNAILYFNDDQRAILKNYLYSQILDFMDDCSDQCDPKEKSQVEALINAAPQVVKLNELLQYKKVRSIQVYDFGIVMYDFFPCRFYLENDELYFHKTGGSQRKMGMMGRIDDYNLAFTGCWYIENNKPTGFTNEEFLIQGVAKKIAPNKLLMAFEKHGRGYEIYEFVK